jgi:hypothetical protein
LNNEPGGAIGMSKWGYSTHLVVIVVFLGVVHMALKL